MGHVHLGFNRYERARGDTVEEANIPVYGLKGMDLGGQRTVRFSIEILLVLWREYITFRFAPHYWDRCVDILKPFAGEQSEMGGTINKNWNTGHNKSGFCEDTKELLPNLGSLVPDDYLFSNFCDGVLSGTIDINGTTCPDFAKAMKIYFKPPKEKMTDEQKQELKEAKAEKKASRATRKVDSVTAEFGHCCNREGEMGEEADMYENKEILTAVDWLLQRNLLKKIVIDTSETKLHLQTEPFWPEAIRPFVEKADDKMIAAGGKSASAVQKRKAADRAWRIDMLKELYGLEDYSDDSDFSVDSVYEDWKLKENIYLNEKEDEEPKSSVASIPAVASARKDNNDVDSDSSSVKRRKNRRVKRTYPETPTDERKIPGRGSSQKSVGSQQSSTTKTPRRKRVSGGLPSRSSTRLNKRKKSDTGKEASVGEHDGTVEKQDDDPEKKDEDEDDETTKASQETLATEKTKNDDNDKDNDDKDGNEGGTSDKPNDNDDKDGDNKDTKGGGGENDRNESNQTSESDDRDTAKGQDDMEEATWEEDGKSNKLTIHISNLQNFLCPTGIVSKASNVTDDTEEESVKSLPRETFMRQMEKMENDNNGFLLSLSGSLGNSEGTPQYPF